MHPVNGQQSTLASIASAIKGWRHALRGRSFRLLFIGGIVAAALLNFAQASYPEQGIFIILVILTLAAELLNTAIEELADALIKEHHPGVARVKELSAGAVLLTGLLAIMVWIEMLLPYLLKLFDASR